MVNNVRVGKDYDENGGMNLDVQVQIEQAVMVDYGPKVHRKPRAPWERKQSGIAGSGDTSFADQGQWELTNATKTGSTV